MSGLEVLAIPALVGTIVSAFTGATSLYRAWRNDRRERFDNAENARLNTLVASSGRRVQSEYDADFRRLCRRFARGDDISRMQLMQHVITLQSTVIELLNVSAAVYTVHPNHDRLISYATRTRDGSVSALGELFQRLSQSAPLVTAPTLPARPVIAPAVAAPSTLATEATRNAVNLPNLQGREVSLLRSGADDSKIACSTTEHHTRHHIPALRAAASCDHGGGAKIHHSSFDRGTTCCAHGDGAEKRRHIDYCLAAYNRNVRRSGRSTGSAFCSQARGSHRRPETITCEQLFDRLERSRVLLIDVRTRADFDAGHINAPSIMCIAPSILRPAVSTTDIQESLTSSPRGERDMFYTRHEYSYIVYYDENTLTNLQLPATLQSLHNAVAVSGAACRLLAGGLQGWRARFGPQSLITSHVAESVEEDAPASGRQTDLALTERNVVQDCSAAVEIETDVDAPNRILLTCHECDFHAAVDARDVHPTAPRLYATTRDAKRLGYTCLVQRFHHSADGGRRAEFRCFLCRDGRVWRWPESLLASAEDEAAMGITTLRHGLARPGRDRGPLLHIAACHTWEVCGGGVCEGGGFRCGDTG